ncbi:hypothetical protein [Paenibacillus nasutitermitis]|uniref:Uncharacterized protein n=1 Tax=Paenibacillus nasutitermitis TaxID=1652958 RepID=A0A917DUE7_9BACL|nr:hypothetical protein [Paenibacillus nasutitermitis]GGD68154.1 hypothetical protein GCM10010911_27400 [Paenibacillus nasutitermitis]
MTYRSIDLQVSIPRTPEKGNLQSQMNQKPILDQAQLEGDTVKQTEQQRSRNTEIEQSAKPGIHNQQQPGYSSKRKRPGEEKEESALDEAANSHAAPDHPYKGKHIDISL